MQAEVRRAALHFIGEMKRSQRRCDLFTFKRSVQPFSQVSQIQTFNYSDSQRAAY
jgi:hypothetical protein